MDFRALRTHGGLIGAFGNHLVKNGPVPKEAGRILNRAHEVRLLADYRADSVTPEDAKPMIEQALLFIATVRHTCLPGILDSEKQTAPK